MQNIKESNYFSIHYDDKDLSIIKETEAVLKENLDRLMKFFNLSLLSSKSL